jgi:hypothetical protein
LTWRKRWLSQEYAVGRKTSTFEELKMFLDTNDSIAPVSFPSSKQEMVGNSTMNLQKFDDGWKIVASHTGVAGM